MGRFHPHSDGTTHDHDHEPRPRPRPGARPRRHDHDARRHDHGDGRTSTSDVGDHSGYTRPGRRGWRCWRTSWARTTAWPPRTARPSPRPGCGPSTSCRRRGRARPRCCKRTLAALSPTLRIGILEGDIATSIDADQLEGFGADVALVNTSKGFGGECHLDAVMVRSGLARLPLADIDLLVIENVGNLVCPAEFKVGEHAKAMVYAVTEGEEKPLKYPVMFRAVDVVVVNKIDLLPYLDFDLDQFLANLHDVNPTARVIQASARTGEGIDEWCAWLVGQTGDPSESQP